VSVPLFAASYRASGVLLHVTSLPSRYGIGDVGPAAVAWVDRLHDAGQRWWQALPLGPTGYGDSPYQSLIEDELARPTDCAGASSTSARRRE
jgi:4-alpha-glucanotransferase